MYITPEWPCKANNRREEDSKRALSISAEASEEGLTTSSWPNRKSSRGRGRAAEVGFVLFCHLFSSQYCISLLWSVRRRVFSTNSIFNKKCGKFPKVAEAFRCLLNTSRLCTWLIIHGDSIFPQGLSESSNITCDIKHRTPTFLYGNLNIQLPIITSYHETKRTWNHPYCLFYMWRNQAQRLFVCLMGVLFVFYVSQVVKGSILSGPEPTQSGLYLFLLVAF